MNEALTGPGRELIVELTAKIVAADVSKHVIPASELSSLITDVHTALGHATSDVPEAVIGEKQKPAVSVRKSVQDDQLICLECGNGFKSLKRHLMTNHSVSPDEYREKWDLPADYPMVAPAYAEARSRLARVMGLGRKKASK